jgi:hypothetical protein
MSENILTDYDLKKSIVNTLCFHIEQQTNEDGRIKHGVVKEVLQLHKSSCPWLTRDVINSALQRRKKLPDTNATQTTFSSLSTLTPADDASPISQVGCHVAPEGGASLQPANCCVSAPGRPKGTTEAAKRAHKEKIHRVKCEISVEWQAKVEADRANGCKKAKGLQKLVDEKLLEHDLRGETISLSTIRSRVARNQADTIKPGGLESPMAEVEPKLLAVLIQLARMRDPQNCTQALELANSMIAGTETAAKVLEWKKKYSPKNIDGPLLGLL